MGNDIVKFNNQFNNVALRGFTSNQLSLLLAIASKMKEKENNEVIFSYDELKKMINLEKNYTIDEFTYEIVAINKKLLKLDFMLIDEDTIIQFTFFSAFETNPNKQTLLVQVNSRFHFLLNQLSSNFTRFELEEFVNISSSYAKECYRRLKQYKSTGKWKVHIDEFRRLLDIPDTYRMCDIDKWVLKPIEKELTPLFKNFRMQKIKTKGRGRGGVVSFIDFRFTVDKINKDTTTSNTKQIKTSFINNKSYVDTPSLTGFELENFILSKNDLDDF